MDYIAATDELKKGTIHAVYLVYGSEDLLRHEFLAALRSATLPADDEWNLSRLEWPASAADVLGLCSTLPFFAERRLVIVQGAGLFAARKGKAAADEDTDGDDASGGNAKEAETPAASGDEAAWQAYFNTPNRSTVLVFTGGENVDRRTRLFKLIDKIGRTVECAQFRKQRELVNWLRVRATGLGIKITEDAAGLLAISVAGGLRGLSTELEKLSTFVGKGGVVDRDAVAALVPRTAEVRVFDLIDSVAEGRQREALDLLAEALVQGEQPLKITALLGRQFRLALQARVLVEQGAQPPKLAEDLGLHPFVAEKLHRQCRRFSRDALCRAMELLLGVDVAIKTGRREPRLALEVLVVELLRLAR